MSEQPEFSIETDSRKRLCRCGDYSGICRVGEMCFWMYFNDYPDKQREFAEDR